MVKFIFNKLNIVNIEHQESEELEQRISEIIFRNNFIGSILETNEFRNVLEQEKRLKGETKLGIIMCIDGRISIIHQFGRTANTKEVAGSMVEVNKETEKLIDRRFISILNQTADEGQELLQIVTAHTSLRHRDHKCGAITNAVQKGIFQGEIDDVALEQAELRARAIEDKYNEILKAKGKTPQKKVAITAMIDTDTMGFVLNFGKENELSSTRKTLEISSQIQQEIGEEVGDFGSMKDDFTKPEKLIEYSKRVFTITKWLMENQVFNQQFNDYLQSNFSDLSASQKKALFFVFARTIANQYLTGLASEEEIHHPFSEHNEDYLVISPHGKSFGRFDLRQSFGSVPASREDALVHLKTKLAILDKNKGKKPYILFFSTPVNTSISADSLRGIEDATIAYFQEILKDQDILEKVKNGDLVIVPVLVDENSGKILGIRDYSIYL